MRKGTHKTKPIAPESVSKTSSYTADSFRNLQASMGITANNQLSNSTYALNPITRNKLLLEFAYRSSWIAGMAVDAPAEDMCRAGISISCDLLPDEVEAIHNQMQDLQIWTKLSECMKWARLFGGSVGYIMIDGQDPAEPLDLDTIGKDDFKGIFPIDKWMLQIDLSQTIREFGPDFGLPEFYKIFTQPFSYTPTGKQRKNDNFLVVHHSRVMRFTGIELPFHQKLMENSWGESVLERFWDRLLAYDSTSTGAAQLIYKAHLRVMKIDGLREISTNPVALEGLAAQMDFMRATQSNEGITTIDGTDEFNALTYSFSGLADMMLQFGEQISGALQIPLVRLFGQSPAGLNSSGESDLLTYYDSLSKQQEQKLRAPLVKIVDILSRSVLGKAMPRGSRIAFNPLWLTKDAERVETASKTIDTILKVHAAGLIDGKMALTEIQQDSNNSGLFTNITTDIINSFENNTNSVGNTPEIPKNNQNSEKVATFLNKFSGPETPNNSNKISEFIDKHK